MELFVIAGELDLFLQEENWTLNCDHFQEKY